MPVAIKKARAIKDEIKANLKAKEDVVDIYKHKTLVVYKCLQVIEYKNRDNWKQWKWKLEMENGSGKSKQSKLMQINARVKL